MCRSQGRSSYGKIDVMKELLRQRLTGMFREEISLIFSPSMVKLMLSWQPVRYHKQIKEVSLLSNMVKMSSTYVNKIEDRALPVMTHFPSKQLMKMSSSTGPTREPIATPSICS